MTMGKGTVQSMSTKQKVNTRSSTEAELVSVDDIILKVLWTRRFLEAQSYGIMDVVVYHDNLSTMKLEEKGRASSRKRTHHFHIKFFYITDLIQQQLLHTEYCPTADMVSDYMTKPLIGAQFRKFRKIIMNLP